MLVFSVLDMFTVGVGPSSSHTVGPMKAAYAFASSVAQAGKLEQVSRIHVTLYGSLALTGRGHGTDRAALAGLEGSTPQDVDTQHLLRLRDECERTRQITLFSEYPIRFDYEQDLSFNVWKRMAAHPNGIRFEAFDCNNQIVDEQVWYSIGGGFIQQGEPDDVVLNMHDLPMGASSDSQVEQSASTHAKHGLHRSSEFASINEHTLPYYFADCSQLIALCEKNRISIPELVMSNELVSHSTVQIRTQAIHVWDVMRNCVIAGCTSQYATLPGGMDVARRAPAIYRQLLQHGDLLHGPHVDASDMSGSLQADWVNLFALAVSEENAGGGRIVTAPTNGAAGIIPAVLHYYWHFVEGAHLDGIVQFLLTAGAVGYLFKRNGSISGAEVGCQGEVGSACSMAAAGLCAVLGGSAKQIENAAEIGIEHHLGLTCDPVGGLVQIPCIERNAMAANTAINAARMALLGDGSHRVSLDQAIKTMKDTGTDMMDKYKETAKGGLAVNVVEC